MTYFEERFVSMNFYFQDKEKTLLEDVKYIYVCVDLNAPKKEALRAIMDKACIAALKRLRKRGMRIGGRHRFVVIDESKFAHKQKLPQPAASCLLLLQKTSCPIICG
ncbi:hypothetical protein DNTS_025701 [Danionella cerebrum]|uniref:Uncharacterized protein n=1 Tax=Danionella cerebrum TaxID=2873325 RepID=A0A553MTE0_9TELE|nr:hypothetical protein DNTS_025701 [Danionella translucida]